METQGHYVSVGLVRYLSALKWKTGEAKHISGGYFYKGGQLIFTNVRFGLRFYNKNCKSICEFVNTETFRSK